MRSDDWEEVKGKNCNKDVMKNWFKEEERRKVMSDARETLKGESCCCDIAILGRSDEQLNVVEEALRSIQGEWELLPVNVDSGAIDSCMPKNTCSHFKLGPSDMSRKGAIYVAANGTEIDNVGQRDVKGMTSEGNNASMTFQVADVKGALGSVHRICEAGNRVMFDDEGSYVEY